MRIGVAGVGRIGTMHAIGLGVLKTVDEVLLYDEVPGRAREVTGSVAVYTKPVDRLEDLLAACDGVVVASPTGSHPEMVRRCVAAGVPALCEKPAAASPGELAALIGDVDRSGVPVLVGFQRRFDPLMVELHRRIRAGEVGTIYHVRATGNDATPPDPAYLPLSGGIFRDLLIHDLDAVPWLVGEPVVEVYASGSVLVDKAFADIDDVDNVVAVLRFAGGAHAVLVGGRRNPLGYDHRIEVLGSKDSLAVGLGARTPVTSLEPDAPTTVMAPYAGFADRFLRAYRNEMAVFVDVIAGRAENPSPLRDSVISARLAEACDSSRRTGAPVRLDDTVVVH